MQEPHHPWEGLLGSDFSQRTFERHAALLGDNHMAHAMYVQQRAAIVMQLQRDYGNQYVQRLVDHITQKREQKAQLKLMDGLGVGSASLPLSAATQSSSPVRRLLAVKDPDGTEYTNSDDPGFVSEAHLPPMERRVKAHLLLCVLAYYVQRAMEQALAPLLFADEAPPRRPDPVAPAPRSDEAKRKGGSKKTIDGFPEHSFRTLLADPGTIVKNRLILKGVPEAPGFEQVTVPTQLQAGAFDLLQLPINPL